MDNTPEGVSYCLILLKNGLHLSYMGNTLVGWFYLILLKTAYI